MLRRVLFLLAGLVGLVLLAGVALPVVQARRLGKRLEADVAAARARVVPLATVVDDVPPVENGFACVAEALEGLPEDLSLFKLNRAEGVPDLAPWWRGEAPLETLPAEWVAEAERLTPWAARLRGCGAARALQYTDAMLPWSSQPRHAEALMALTRVTALELRHLVAAGQPGEAARRCRLTLAVALDQSHLGLLGAMLAYSAATVLVPRCAEALDALPVEARTPERWADLRGRAAPASALVETERLKTSVVAFSALGDVEVPSRPAEADFEVSSPLVGLLLRTVWHSWDARMRALAQARPGVEFELASEALETGAWMRLEPNGVLLSGNYRRFVGRVAEGHTLVAALAWLAAGEAGAPPAGVRRGDDDIVWIDTDGRERPLRRVLSLR